MVSARFNFLPTPLAGLTVIQRRPVEDIRGVFSRLYCAEEFQEIVLTKPIVQINYSVTRHKGVVRGMHFQYPPHAEVKIVSCLKGEIFDVAADIRSGSPTFLKWHGEVLSSDNHRSLLIPEGFAHGFQAMTDNCELLYLHTERYVPSAEGAINVQDPSISIAWPLPIIELSDRDRAHPFIDKQFSGVVI